MLRSSRTSLMPTVLAENAFLTSSDAPSGGLGSASPGSPAWQTLHVWATPPSSCCSGVLLGPPL